MNSDKEMREAYARIVKASSLRPRRETWRDAAAEGGTPGQWTSTAVLGILLFAAGWGAARGHRWTFCLLFVYLTLHVIAAYGAANHVKEDP